MGSPAVDGADSAEDLGSSLPYRSTLPGIPKVIVLDYRLFFKSEIFIEVFCLTLFLTVFLCCSPNLLNYC